MALPEMRVRISADTADVESGFDRVANGANQVGAATDRMASRVAGASRRIAETTRSSSAASRGFQNLGFQINDFAVQVGSGQAASVALAQQLPQLLQGFGLVGVALSVVAAVGIPVVKLLVTASEGAKLTSSQFGSLEPVIIDIANGFKSLKTDVGDALKVLGDNMDRILTTAGSVAAFFAGRWVVSAVAARVATMTVTASLVALRGALIRTGFGAAAVLLGEFVHQLISANSWLRGILIKIGALSAASIQELKVQQNGLNTALAGYNSELDVLAGKRAKASERNKQYFDEQTEVLNRDKQATQIKLAGITAEIAGYEKLATAKKSVTLLDFSKKKDDKKSEADKAEELRKKELDRQREHLAAGLMAIRESQLSEKQMLFKHLLDKQLIIADAFDQGLVGQAERDTLTEELQGEHFQRLRDMEQAKADQEAAKKGEHFQRITDLTKGNLSDQLGAWGGYFQNLASLAGTSNNKLFAGLKIFAAGEALINAWRAFNQVIADPTLPWYAKLAAGASVLAAGLGAVSAIQGATQGGGGKKSSGGGGGGGGAQAAAPQPLNVRLSGIGASDFISGGQLGTLLERLDDEAGDRGYRLMTAA